jgi:hypothetical protein
VSSGVFDGGIDEEEVGFRMGKGLVKKVVTLSGVFE